MQARLYSFGVPHYADFYIPKNRKDFLGQGILDSLVPKHKVIYMSDKDKKDAPIKHMRDGGLQVSVWKNKSKDDDVFYSSTLKRSYKDGDEWKDTNSLNESDLLRAGRLLARAHDWIVEKKQEDKKKDD